MDTQVRYIFGTGQGAHDFDNPEYRTPDGRTISFDPPCGELPANREIVETFVNEDGRIVNQSTRLRHDWYFFVLRHSGQYETIAGKDLDLSNITVYGSGPTPSAAESDGAYIFDGE